MSRSDPPRPSWSRSCLLSGGLLLVLAAWSGAAAVAHPKGEDHSDRDLQNMDFSGRDLEDDKYENSDCQRTNFENALLARASFRGANLERANLKGADCAGADFRQANLRYMSVQGGSFAGANFEGQDLTFVVLQKTSFRGANLRNLKAIGSCAEVDFRAADLRGANLEGYVSGSATPNKFRGATYDRATRWPKGLDVKALELVLVGADGKPVDGAGTPTPPKAPPGLDFARQDLAGREFVGKDLSGASFFEADLPRSKFRTVTAPLASFSGADLTEARFEGCDLSGADLRRIRTDRLTMTETKLDGANLQGVDLSGAHLVKVSLVGADLRSVRGLVTLSECDLSQSDLRGANLTRFGDAYAGIEGKTVKWTGARYDKRTRWPPSFDPQAAGAVLAE